jgi:cell division septation protein DedD
MPPRKPLAGDKTAMADKPDRTAATTKSAVDKAATDKKDAPETKTAAVRSATTASAPRAATGGWWVQVGAFRDENKAHNLAAKLRQDNYSVEQTIRRGAPSVTKSAAADKSAPAASTSGPAGADQYDVFVSGLSADELSTRLGAKGLTAEPSGAGAVIKPSLPLREAVALSKDLAMDGLKVQVRRAAGASAPAPRAPETRAAPTVRGAEGLYRVRVGAFPDKATAMTTLKELEAKGYKPFISRGGP